jgi:hypothetical protein
MFIIYLQTILYTPGSNGPLVITAKLKVRQKICMTTMLFHIIQENYLKKVAYFSNTYYHTIFQDLPLIGGSDAPISQVHPSAILSLLIVGNKNESWGSIHWHNIHTKFH